MMLFARSAKEHSLLSAQFEDSVKAERKLQWTYFWTWFSYSYLFVIVQGLNLYFLLHRLEDGRITAGNFAIVLSISFTIADSIWQLTHEFGRFARLWRQNHFC